MDHSHMQDQDPARERLLDAALAEVLGRRNSAAPAGRAESSARHRHSLPSGMHHRWLAVALVLLGTAAVVGIGITAGPLQQAPIAASVTPRGQDPQGPIPQDPQPIPLPTECNSVADLEAAASHTRNLSVKLSNPSDLEMLARFTELRVLTLRGGDKDSIWALSDLDVTVLHPLQKLRKLEQLTLPTGFALRPEHVRSLRALPALRAISVVGSHPLPDGVAIELAALPGLRELEFRMCRVTASFLEILKPVGLTHLSLGACPDLEQAELEAITAMESLQFLALTSRHGGGCSIGGRRYTLAEMAEPEFAMINALPNLTGLDLDESHFHDRLMSQLPRQLRYLRLGDHVMQPLTIAALARLQDLEELRFHQGRHGKDAIALLQLLRLKRLWLRGWSDNELIQALAGNVTIEELTLRYRGQAAVDLAPLVKMPKLRSLCLRPDPVIPGRDSNLPGPLVMRQFQARGIEFRVDHGDRD